MPLTMIRLPVLTAQSSMVGLKPSLEVNEERTSIQINVGISQYEAPISDLRKVCAVFRNSPPEIIRDAIDDVTSADYTKPTLILAYRWLKQMSPETLRLGEIDGEAALKAFRLVELYAIACELGCYKLQNDILSAFQARDTCRLSYPSRRFIKAVYKHAPKHSTLREYVVDTFVFKSKDWDPVMGRDHWVRLHTEYGNTAFVQDVQRIEKYTAAKRVVGSNPNRRSKCHYHHHHRGVACSQKQTKKESASVINSTQDLWSG